MYLTYPPKPRAVTRCLAASRTHVGNLNFQPDATGRTRLSKIYYLLQEISIEKSSSKT
jgi:hypothetical protein